MNISQHGPQRTCIACRQAREKQELVRLVCGADGKVEVDTSGRRAGRGAYLCRVAECWEMGLKGNRLERALRTSLTLENREELARYERDHLLPS